MQPSQGRTTDRFHESYADRLSAQTAYVSSDARLHAATLRAHALFPSSARATIRYSLRENVR
ncbi:hypothetical protein A5791_09745 [Mycobacterium sp. 852002-51163_SCH5372311]|nr:hypothetical protein A5791_09745 [Mycobacterium sp. 852002-51163_SCH5372311]